MSAPGSLVPSNAPGGALSADGGSNAVQTWGPPAAPPAAASGGLNFSRYVSALKRYKWLIAIVVLLGAIGGVVATQFIPPKYTVGATVVVGESPDPKGPVRPQQMMNANAWKEFLTSYAILDPVAKRLGLYVTPEEISDSVLFSNFEATADLRSGDYRLETDPAARRYQLSIRRGREWNAVESGALGDSVGRAVGFQWLPNTDQLVTRRDVEFEVRTPRETAVELRDRINVFLPMESRFMWLSYTGERPQQLATTLNEVLREFLVAAEGLKKRNLTDFAQALADQTEQAKANLQRIEGEYEAVKVANSIYPTDELPLPTLSGLSTNPALTDFHKQRVDLQTTQRDREALEAMLAAEGTRLTAERVMGLPGVYETSPNLKAAVEDLTTNQAALRRLKERYTDEHPLVVDMQAKIDEAQTRVLPSIAQQSLEQLRRKEAELDRRLGTAQQEMRAIPSRMIREQALARERDLAANIYADLGGRLELAKIAEASALPDVSVLDSAVAPLRPSSNTAPMILLMVIGASLGLGILLAIALDLFDKRFRYPEQATNELGLDVLGAIPTIRRTKSGATRMEDEAQLVEAFRGLRLNVRNAANGDGGPVSLSISSPGPGDGKSLISSNLALAFAEAGYRTLLIDGDIRRGQLHSTFGVPQRPGLVDHLGGDIAIEDVIRETSHQNLFLITCGTRRHRGPELLAADGTAKLLRALRNRFDAIIVDTAPLGAGIDPYALGAATGNMLLVLRTGKTDRKLAQAKLTTLDRLPVRLVGAVLNDIQAEGMYKYYAYLDGYGTLEEDEEPTRLVPAGDNGSSLPAGRG